MIFGDNKSELQSEIGDQKVKILVYLELGLRWIVRVRCGWVGGINFCYCHQM